MTEGSAEGVALLFQPSLSGLHPHIPPHPRSNTGQCALIMIESCGVFFLPQFSCCRLPMFAVQVEQLHRWRDFSWGSEEGEVGGGGDEKQTNCGRYWTIGLRVSDVGRRRRPAFGRCPEMAINRWKLQGLFSLESFAVVDLVLVQSDSVLPLIRNSSVSNKLTCVLCIIVKPALCFLDCFSRVCFVWENVVPRWCSGRMTTY